MARNIRSYKLREKLVRVSDGMLGAVTYVPKESDMQFLSIRMEDGSHKLWGANEASEAFEPYVKLPGIAEDKRVLKALIAKYGKETLLEMIEH